MPYIGGETLARPHQARRQPSRGRRDTPRARDRGCARVRARAGRHPPRHQARERAPLRRARARRRLRHRARGESRGRTATHRCRLRDRHALLHEPRAGLGRSHRRPQRSLQPRLRLLRDARGEGPVQRTRPRSRFSPSASAIRRRRFGRSAPRCPRQSMPRCEKRSRRCPRIASRACRRFPPRSIARRSRAPAQDNRKLVVPPKWRWAAGAVAFVAIAALFFAFRPAPLDPELYVVLPFVHRANAAPQLLDGDNCQQLLYEAFGRWNGITLVDDMRAHDARSRVTNAPLSLKDALRTARSLRAGRMAWGEVWAARGDINVRGLIYDVRTEQPVKQYTVDPSLRPGRRRATIRRARRLAARPRRRRRARDAPRERRGRAGIALHSRAHDVLPRARGARGVAARQRRGALPRGDRARPRLSARELLARAGDGVARRRRSLGVAAGRAARDHALVATLDARQHARIRAPRDVAGQVRGCVRELRASARHPRFARLRSVVRTRRLSCARHHVS